MRKDWQGPPMGLRFKMMKNDATIRHQVSRGNGGNPIVNDRIPMRFIIAPTDVANVTWMQAEGAGDGNGNLNADFRSTAATGCRSYKIAGDPNRKWRVPTQRELQLMWLFREPVGVIYPAAQMENVSSKYIGLPQRKMLPMHGISISNRGASVFLAA